MEKKGSRTKINTEAPGIPSQNLAVANIAQQQTPVDPRAQRHRYSGWVLAALAIGNIVSLILVFADPALYPNNPQYAASPGFLGMTGTLLLTVISIIVLVIDWRGFVTINGFIKWRRMPIWLRIIVGYFALGLWPVIILPIYLFQAFQTYRYFKQQEPLERRRRIAELEAQLGFMPYTEGTCRACQKPLQVGAIYCAHCGASVIEQPRICPKCATTTFPDAKWCPKCRYPLDAASQSV